MRKLTSLFSGLTTSSNTSHATLGQGEKSEKRASTTNEITAKSRPEKSENAARRDLQKVAKPSKRELKKQAEQQKDLDAFNQFASAMFDAQLQALHARRREGN